MQQVKNQDWQNEIRNAYRNVKDLLKANLVSQEEEIELSKVVSKYSLFLTPYYASLIDKSDPNCPIRLQAIPSVEEFEVDRALSSDPLADLKNQPAPRITHRYANRALLHLTSNCSMNCRYCFRKSLLNDLKEDFIGGDLEKSLNYLNEKTEIEEVILSGGDPLMISDTNLESVLNKLSSISHLKRVRIHTRVPVTCPMRVTEEFISSFSNIATPLIFVLHFNHPKEVTEEAIQAVEKIKKVSAQVLNQSVLLKGVNDSAFVLKELSEKLFSAGVLPYYLHHPDRASGTKHFQMTKSDGLKIYHKLQTILPGYLVPRYVQDNSEKPYKDRV